MPPRQATATPLSALAPATAAPPPPARQSASRPERRITVVTDRLPRIGDGASVVLPGAGAPPRTLGNGLPGGVITDRLPRIGDGGAVAPPPAAAPGDPAALERNSEPFDNPEGRPILAVVLLDDPGVPPARLPFDFSVALDGADPGAAQRGAAYRAAGIEVLIRPQLPPGARPGDVAVGLQDSFRRLPMAVAVLEGADPQILGDREAEAQLLAEVAEGGHGLVAMPRGLDSLSRQAGRQGIPARAVSRDVDGMGQDQRAIRRFLDQAAFRARQDAAVIVVARNRPDTIAALTSWATGNRAAGIALAPVSAALRSGTQ